MTEYIKKDEVLKEIHELYEVIKEIQKNGWVPYKLVLYPVVQDLLKLIVDITHLETKKIPT